MSQRNVGHRLKTAAAISTYDQTNIDGGSCYFSPGMAQGFLVVRLARLAAQHPGLDIEVATDLRLVSLERRETEVFKCEAAPAGATERRAA